MKYFLSLWILWIFNPISAQDFPLPSLKWGPLLQQPIEAKMAGIIADSTHFYAWRYGKFARKGTKCISKDTTRMVLWVYIES